MDHRGNELEAGYSDFTEIATPGSNPASGVLRAYAKSDDNLYILNHGGSETKVGAGSYVFPLLVQDNTQNGSANTNSLGLTLAAAPTASNFLVLVSQHGDAGTISSITQTNVSWALLKKFTQGTTPTIEIWLGTVSASAGTGITVAYSTTNYSQYLVSEWSGLAGTLDAFKLSGVASGSPGLPGNFLAGSKATALIISGMSTISDVNLYTPATVFGNMSWFPSGVLNSMRIVVTYGFGFGHQFSNQNSAPSACVSVSLL